MSVYKKTRGARYYSYDFYFRGRRYTGSTGAEGRKKAKRVEQAKREKAAFEAASGQRPDMTLGAATVKFYDEVSQWEKSEATQLYQLENLCRIIGKRVYLDEIGDPELANFVSRRRGEYVKSRRKDREPTGKLVSNSTVNREVELLRRVIRRAKKTWKVNVGEIPDFSDAKLTEPKGRIRYLRDEEETRFFKHLRDDFHPLALFCMMTGIRQAGATGLTWDRVDFKAAVVTVFLKTKQKEPEPLNVPMTGALKALLATQRSNHDTFVFTYVCRKSRGKDRQKGQRYPFTRSGWRSDWTKALEAAGIKDFKFHDLRHTAATRTLKNCRNLKIVQQMLGHSDIASTARYAHVLDEDVREAMEVTHSHHSPTVVSSKDANGMKGKN